MKKTWRDRMKDVDLKKGSGNVGKYARYLGKSLKNTRFVSPFRSVGMKLFLIIFCGILACVVALGMISYTQARKVIETKVAESTIETSAQTAGRMDLLLSGYERKTMEFLSDAEFTTLLSSAISATDDYERFDSQRNLTNKLSSVMLSDSMLAGIYLIPSDPNMEVMGSASSGGLPNVSENMPAFVTQMVEASGKVVWVPTMPKGVSGNMSSGTIAVGRAMMSVNSNNPYVLVIEVHISALDDMLETVDFGDGSSTYIVAPDGTIVYSPVKEEMGTAYGYELPASGSSSNFKLDKKEYLTVGADSTANGWKVVGNMPIETLTKDAGVIARVTWIVGSLSALIAGAIGWFIVWSIGRPLGQLRNLMNEGERGNLTVRSNIRSKDEIGQVADSFNRMMENITNLVMKTTESAAEVLATAASLGDASRKTAGAAKEIAIATEEIASGATNLAVESERGSEMTGEIGNQVQLVIASNTEMGRSAAEVEEAGRRGTDYMAGLIQKTGQTEEMTRSMVEKVDKLQDSTRSIRKILDVLGNLTKQTNILSLNATIEAARAGAAGKGFMVVADEIHKLADQSRQSIGVVGEVVETIQNEIEETVSVLSEAYPLFKQQIESVREATEIFHNVQEQMNLFAERLDSATQSVGRLEEAQSTLSLAMTNVSAVAQQSSATSEEVASLSNEQLNISEGLVQLSSRLEAVSVQLRESLSKFTVQ
ncbi:methyl-accepting chemotaxis protein [Cohnella massiliensis]|uniref:methyl-accepting chemotaxis protein n=1 Tax=Cohnella massiliensis TaxID=1816691 RepID=UPI001FE9AF45|nr:methyl-accepting chemotaxis protein [Cohnella massiliensis]